MDADGDGLISYAEYMFFNTLLASTWPSRPFRLELVAVRVLCTVVSHLTVYMVVLTVPERQFELAFKMFDADGNGRLDHREFKQVRSDPLDCTIFFLQDTGPHVPSTVAASDHRPYAPPDAVGSPGPVAQGGGRASLQAPLWRTRNVRLGWFMSTCRDIADRQRHTDIGFYSMAGC